MMPAVDEDVVLCPPDRSIPIPWLAFKHALQQEFAAEATAEATAADTSTSTSTPTTGSSSATSGDADPQQQRQQQQQLFSELLHLIELLAHSQYLGDARYLQAALMAAQPQLSEEDRQLLSASISGQDTQAVQAHEQQLLSVIIRLLLEGRYTPLTSQEWSMAQENDFTFDIPVSIDWKVLDDQLLKCFWNAQQQQQQQQQQQFGDSSETAGADSKSSFQISSSSSQCGSDSSGSSSSLSSKHQQQHEKKKQSAQQQQQQFLLDACQLPSFSDRLLVFHRGVGVATAPGLYLPQKLDLLIEYTVVQPVMDVLQGLATAVTGKAQQLQQHSRQLLQRSSQPQHQQGEQEDRQHTEQQQQPRSASRQYSLASRASSDVDHPAARVVARRSLRSLMPGPGQVLRRFWEPLLLQEPTYRSVVVLYRAATAPPPPPPHGAETAVTAALHAGVGHWLAAAQSAAEARTATQAAAAAAAATAKAAAAAVATEAKAAATAVASEAKAAAVTAIQAARQSLTPHADAAQRVREARVSLRMRENPHNLIIKSFADVAVADLELVMPSKQVQVQSITLVRSALAALGALAAFLALLQQADAVHWSPSLVFLPAVGLVAGRAIKVLTTIKSHQSALTSTMLSMAYSAARDSQEGVLCKLLDELRDSTTKEAALAATALLLNCWQDTQQATQQQQDQQQQQQDQQQQQQQQQTTAGIINMQDSADTRPDGNSSSSSSSTPACSSSRDAFTLAEIDAACEEFLDRRYGLQVDLVTSDALQQLLQWGIAQQDASGCFRPVPLQAAVEQLRAQALRSISDLQQQQQQQQQQQADAPRPPSPQAHIVQMRTDNACMSDSTGTRSDSPSSSNSQDRSAAGVDVSAAAAASSSRLHAVSSHQQQQRCGRHGQMRQQQHVPRQYQGHWGARCAHTSSSCSRHTPVLRGPRVSVAGLQQLAAGLSCFRGVL